MNLTRVFSELIFNDYNEWKSHQVDGLARTTSLENDAMASPLGWWIDLFNFITPITKKAVLLDESQKSLFKHLGEELFDGKTIGILYHSYSPGKEPVTFYLTKRMQPEWARLLGVPKTPEEIKREDKEQSDLLEKRLDVLRTVAQEAQPTEAQITPNIIQSDETVDALLLCSFKEFTQLSDEDRLRLLKKAAFRGNRHALFWYVADYIKFSENVEEKSLYSKICKEVFGEEPEPGYGAQALSDLNDFLKKYKEGF